MSRQLFSSEEMEIRRALKEIDESDDIDVTEWEADFLESVFGKFRTTPLTPRQLSAASDIIDKYS